MSIKGWDIFLMGVCFLVAMALRVPSFLDVSGPLGGDEPQYYILGVRLATGRGFTYVPSLRCPVPVPVCSDESQSLDEALHANGVPTARRTPGLPLVLAGIHWIGGNGYPLMRLVLAIVTSLTGPALYCLSLLVFGRRSVALLAGLVWPISPTDRYLAGLLYGEGLSALVLVVGLVLTVLTDRLRSLLLALAAGVTLGYAVLIRPYLLLAVLGPLAWLVVRKSRREAVVLLLVISVILGGWGIRNVVRLGTFSLTTETEALWGGNNAWARGAFAGDWAPQEAYLSSKYPGFYRLDEAARSRLYLQEAMSEAIGNPVRILWLLPRKFVVFFSPSSYLVRVDWLYAILLPFSLFGGAWLVGQPQARHHLWLIAYPVFGVLTVCLLTFGDSRVRHPVDTVLVILASVGLVQAFNLLLVKNREA